MQFIYLYQDSRITTYQSLNYTLILIVQKIQAAFQMLNFLCFQTTLAFIFLLPITFPLYQLSVTLNSAHAEPMSFINYVFAKALQNLISKYPSLHPSPKNHFSF